MCKEITVQLPFSKMVERKECVSDIGPHKNNIIAFTKIKSLHKGGEEECVIGIKRPTMCSRSNGKGLLGLVIGFTQPAKFYYYYNI